MAAGLATPVSAGFLAGLFYLLPAGVGLVVLPPAATMSSIGLRKSEHVLLAYFVGLMVVTLMVVVRERNSSPEMRAELFDPVVLDYALLGVGTYGWIRALREWRDLRGFDNFVRVAVWCSPLFVVPYTLTFLVFSRYPLTDLFQFTHIMKGAEEFAAFDRLNPFTADSYAPVIQPLLGSLLRLTGSSSLDAVWLAPLPAYLLRVAVLYVLATRLLRDASGAVIFVAILLPFFGLGALTNGDLAALGGVLLMALMMATLDRSHGSPIVAWGLVASVIAVLVISTIGTRLLPDWLFLCLLLTGPLAILLSSYRSGVLAAFVTLGVATAAIAPLHRSTVLVVPAIALSLAWARNPLLSRRGLQWMSISLLVIGVVLVAGVLIDHYGNLGFPDPGKALTRVVDVVFGVSFSASQDAIFGTGAKVALFEIARSVGPLVALWSLLIMARCLSGRVNEQDGGSLAMRADATWMAGCALLVVLLLGLPFAYRAVFVPVILFAVLIAQHVAHMHRRDLVHAAASLAALVLIIATAEYAVPETSRAAEHYIDRAMPAVLFSIMPIVGMIIMLMIRPAWARPALVLLLIWAVLFEKQVIRYHFFHYSFPGEPPPRSEPLSHYTAQDAKLAEWIREHYGDGILISDPYTLAITRALTGLNSIVTFSNLDTMNTHAAEELRQYLQGILQTGDVSTGHRNCGEWSEIARLLSLGVSAESNYLLFEATHRALFGRDVLRYFGYRAGLLPYSMRSPHDSAIVPGRHAWVMEKEFTNGPDSPSKVTRRSDRELKIITIINGRTIEWASGLFEGQRHDGADTLESGSSVREMLVARCNAAIGPGNSVILAHPLGTR